MLELLVVIVVIATLATLVAPNVFKHVGAAKDATARSQIEMLASALDAYRLDNSRYPTTAQGLIALLELPSGEASELARTLRAQGRPARPLEQPVRLRLARRAEPERLRSTVLR
ncbi:MAG: type II secretion system protein GspG [Candidatus Entotheonellia bacterium]